MQPIDALTAEDLIATALNRIQINTQSSWSAEDRIQGIREAVALLEESARRIQEQRQPAEQHNAQAAGGAPEGETSIPNRQAARVADLTVKVVHLLVATEYRKDFLLAALASATETVRVLHID